MQNGSGRSSGSAFGARAQTTPNLQVQIPRFSVADPWAPFFSSPPPLLNPPSDPPDPRQRPLKNHRGGKLTRRPCPECCGPRPQPGAPASGAARRSRLDACSRVSLGSMPHYNDTICYCIILYHIISYHITS